MSVETEKNILWYFFTKMDKFDENNAASMMNLVDREMQYTSRIGKENLIMTSEKSMEHHNLRYNTIELDFTMSLEYKELKWTLNISLRFGKNATENDLFQNKFRFMMDDYTMDKDTLMDMEMEEDVTFSDIMRNGESIEKLDTYFLEKKWLKSKFLVPQNKKNTGEQMKDLANYNESFGNMGLLETIGTVLNVSKGTLSTHSEEEEETEEPALASKGLLQSMGMISEMMREIMNESPSESQDLDVSERVNVIKLMDRVISQNFRQTVNLDMAKFKEMYKVFKRQSKMEEFHNFVITVISSHYNNAISDGMIMVLYNIILKKMSHAVVIVPSNNVKKPRSLVIPDRYKFLSSVSENLDTLDFVNNF
jgi:hypothetical protein